MGVKIVIRSPAGSLGVVLLAATTLVAASEAAETRRVMAGRPSYDTSAFHNLFMGSGYRKEWVTPIDFPVLDLATFAGGLTPVRQVGGMQSLGLALKGKDGKSYTFRTTDKDPTKILPPEWADSVPARLFQDATAANHPGNGFVVPALAEAAGVLHTNPRYVFMPDDPALGEFRKTFGGEPGTIEEFPLPGPNGTPGFAGAVEIVSTGELWARSLAGKARVDGEALLRARLFDLWIADWDRHNKQWRWLRREGRELFEPLPEDRDQAFSKFGGLLMSAARATHPKFMDWKDSYENYEGWMTQGTEVDRWMLSEMDLTAFEATATELVARLTDTVIDDAVKRLPPEWYAIRGNELAGALKKRRAGLVAAALEYYARLYRKVDVQGTNLNDAVRVVRHSDGRLEVALSKDGGLGAVVPENLRPARDRRGPALPLRRDGPRGDGGPGGRADHPARRGRVRHGHARRLEKRRDPALRLRGQPCRERAGYARGYDRLGAAPGEAEGNALARVARLGQPNVAPVQGVVGAGPRRHAGGRVRAPDLGLPQVPVRHAPDGAAAVQHRAQRLQVQLRRRVQEGELEAVLRP